MLVVQINSALEAGDTATGEQLSLQLEAAVAARDAEQ
jgi:hypothetical protein